MTKPGDIASLVSATLLSHPRIGDVRLIGSRAKGTAVPLSDWDFSVRCDDVAAVASDLPELTRPLHPLAAQWDRLSPHQCYMLILPGPAKVDLLFLDQPHEIEPPWDVRAESLQDIDRHFWDWALWLAAKVQAGKAQLVQTELDKMSEHLLAPMGVTSPPRSLAAAIASYRSAREVLEARFGVLVPRDLEDEVLPALAGFTA